MGSVNTGPLANLGGPVQVVQVRRLAVDVGPPSYPERYGRGGVPLPLTDHKQPMF